MAAQHPVATYGQQQQQQQQTQQQQQQQQQQQPRQVDYTRQQCRPRMSNRTHGLSSSQALPRMDSNGMMLEIDGILNPNSSTWTHSPSPPTTMPTMLSGFHFKESEFSPASSAVSAMSAVAPSPTLWSHSPSARGLTPSQVGDEFPLHDDVIHPRQQAFFGPTVRRPSDCGSLSGGPQPPRWTADTHRDSHFAAWHRSTGISNANVSLLEQLTSLTDDTRNPQVTSPAPVVLSHIRASVTNAHTHAGHGVHAQLPMAANSTATSIPERVGSRVTLADFDF
jgi:hypothetical protein